jgi:hypothetical protein
MSGFSGWLRSTALFRKVGPVRWFILWGGGQDVALYDHNAFGSGGNDGQIAVKIAAYGFPVVREVA